VGTATFADGTAVATGPDPDPHAAMIAAEKAAMSNRRAPG
jgi:hypothetical protein